MRIWPFNRVTNRGCGECWRSTKASHLGVDPKAFLQMALASYTDHRGAMHLRSSRSASVVVTTLPLTKRAARRGIRCIPDVSPSTRTLIWCDPVNIFESLGWFCFCFLLFSFRGQGQQQPWQVMATIDQADIRGSEPHNHDPSGAASDY
jgi:hypothetical protein